MYKVWVNDALFVIATNRWAAALKVLVTEDREWLHANQVYVHVTQPLWVQEEDDCRASAAAAALRPGEPLAPGGGCGPVRGLCMSVHAGRGLPPSHAAGGAPCRGMN